MDNSRFIPTIVVPVLDRADMIQTTLDSISAQTLRPLSVIVVDNGSTDVTPEIVSRWIARNSGNGISAMLLTEPRRGAAIARNTGLRRVESEYVMFFDSDDVMLPGHMERVAKALAERPDADMIRWEISRLDSDGWLERTEHNDSDPLRLHIMHATYATARFAVRTSLIKESGGWDESLTTWDDLELGTRLLARRPVAIKLSGEPNVRTTVHPDSLTGPSFSSRAEAEIAALDVMERDLQLAGRPEYVPLVDARRMILAAELTRENNPETARRLRRQTARDDCPAGRSLRLLAVYAVQRIAGHGGSALALASLAPTPPRGLKAVKAAEKDPETKQTTK